MIKKVKRPYTPANCPLCKMKKMIEWKFCVTKCTTHPDKWMLVWGKHDREPTVNEKQLMLRVLLVIWPHKKWRGPGSIPEHWHYHEVQLWGFGLSILRMERGQLESILGSQRNLVNFWCRLFSDHTWMFDGYEDFYGSIMNFHCKKCRKKISLTNEQWSRAWNSLSNDGESLNDGINKLDVLV